MRERAQTFDSPDGERSIGRTVAAFNAVTGRHLEEWEGWLFMALLKFVRGATRSGGHQDSEEDAISYAALLAETRASARLKPQPSAGSVRVEASDDNPLAMPWIRHDYRADRPPGMGPDVVVDYRETPDAMVFRDKASAVHWAGVESWRLA